MNFFQTVELLKVKGITINNYTMKKKSINGDSPIMPRDLVMSLYHRLPIRESFGVIHKSVFLELNY